MAIPETFLVVLVPYLVLALFVLCVVYAIVAMVAPPKPKRKKVVLTLEKKEEILGKMDQGWSVSRCGEHYGVPLNTLYDLRKNRGK